MFIKNIKKNKAEISKFEFAYRILHPNEIAPTYEILVELSKDVDKVFLGEYNICFLKELEDKSFEIIAFWCIASKKLPKNENKKCFREVLKAISNLKQKVIISNISNYYKKATQSLNDEYYLFKVSK